MEGKLDVLWGKGYKITTQGGYVYISLPIYGESTTLPEMCDLEDFEGWLNEEELREAKASALERAIYGSISFDEAYQDEVLEMCYEKMIDEIRERVEVWEGTDGVIRMINDYEVRLYTLTDEYDGWITYLVEMQIPVELFEKMSADEIEDLFHEMLEEMDYPDLGITEII